MTTSGMSLTTLKREAATSMTLILVTLTMASKNLLLQRHSRNNNNHHLLLNLLHPQFNRLHSYVPWSFLQVAEHQ